MVITGLTRNQFARKRTRVRIPSSPPLKSTVIYYGGLFLCHKMLNNKNFRLLRYIVPPLWNYSAAEMVRFTVTSFFDIAVIVKQPHSDNTPYEKIGDEVHPLDTPFDIPESWEWVRHNDLFEISGGSQPPKSKFISEARDGYIRLYQIRDYGNNPVPVYIPISAASKISHKGDILLARYGASLGKVFWAEDGAYNVAMARVIPLYETELISKEFLFLFYQSSLYQSVIHANSRSAQAGFNKEDLSSLLFPLPPRSEQERIVCAYEKLQPFLNAYNDAAHSLATMNKDFPEALKKSILQEAVQGKLVPQDQSDEPAEALLERIRAEKQQLIKEGKIKKDKHESVIFRRDNSHYEKLGGVERCIDDELPFEIPENWSWPRIPTISLSISAGGDKPSVFSKVKTEKCSVPVSALQCIVSICTTIITWFCSLQNLFLPQSRWVVFCGFERKIETKLEIKLFLWYNDYKAKEVFK